MLTPSRTIAFQADHRLLAAHGTVRRESHGGVCDLNPAQNHQATDRGLHPRHRGRGVEGHFTAA